MRILAWEQGNNHVGIEMAALKQGDAVGDFV